MRRIALLGFGVLFASVLAALPVNTVLACSCAAWPDTDAAVNAADAAFIGVVVGIDDPAGGDPVFSTGDPIHYTIVVERSLKGDLVPGQEVTVTSARYGASCGQVLAVGERWRLLVSGAPTTFTTGLCSGSELLASGIDVPDQSSAGGQNANLPLLAILAGGALGLLALLIAFAFFGWGTRTATG